MRDAVLGIAGLKLGLAIEDALETVASADEVAGRLLAIVLLSLMHVGNPLTRLASLVAAGVSGAADEVIGRLRLGGWSLLGLIRLPAIMLPEMSRWTPLSRLVVIARLRLLIVVFSAVGVLILNWNQISSGSTGVNGCACISINLYKYKIRLGCNRLVTEGWGAWKIKTN